MSSMSMNNLSSEWSVNLTPQGQNLFQEDSEKSWNISCLAITTESSGILIWELLKPMNFITSAFQCSVQIGIVKDSTGDLFFSLVLDVCQK